ncbi:MAG: pilus assembly protein TadE [Acidimicrobiaceae bacterium]|nr:pilus assembly protein TadE [Acidimicrobiaceae bacterium]
MTQHRDAGSASVELVILAPLIGVLLLAVVVVGRVQVARADVEGVARSAARELAIARDPASSVESVRARVDSMLDAGSPSCRETSFTPEISGQSVTVTIGCLVDLQSAGVLPVPGSITVTATATEVVDVYRERVGG